MDLLWIVILGMGCMANLLKKACATVLAVGAIAGLSACGEPIDPPKTTQRNMNDSTKYAKITLPDGRAVDCLFYTDYKQGGLSCDWDNAK